MGSRTETAIGCIVVFWFTLSFLGIGCFWNGPSGNLVCQLILGIYVALTLIGGLFVILFILNKLCDDSSAREREMRRQIALESPRVIMPNDEKLRD